jgi:hypothetical protein
LLPVADIDGASINAPATLAITQLAATLIDSRDVETVGPAGRAYGDRRAL